MIAVSLTLVLVSHTATSTAGVTLEPPAEAEAEAEADVAGLAQTLLGRVDVHGFVSQGYMRTTHNEYLGHTTDGTFALTEAGINFSVQLTEQLSAGLQFFGRVLGEGDLSAQFDWFYLDYRFNDLLGLRAGRVKLPWGLYNEFSDIDAARVHILLPQAVYPTQNRDFLLAETGGEIYGRIPLARAGALQYRAYGGTVVLDRPSSTGDLDVTSVTTPYIVGGRLTWEAPVDGLRIAGSIQALRLEFDVNVSPEVAARLQMSGMLPADFPGHFSAAIPALLWMASAEYVRGDLLVAAEYGRWAVSLESDQPNLIPATRVDREQFYLLVNYRISDWLHPGVYYSVLFPDVAQREGRAGSTQDVAVSLRFDLMTHWIAKIEAHYLNGTAILSSSLNDGRRLIDLDREWLQFLVNTTLYF